MFVLYQRGVKTKSRMRTENTRSDDLFTAMYWWVLLEYNLRICTVVLVKHSIRVQCIVAAGVCMNGWCVCRVACSIDGTSLVSYPC